MSIISKHFVWVFQNVEILPLLGALWSLLCMKWRAVARRVASHSSRLFMCLFSEIRSPSSQEEREVSAALQGEGSNLHKRWFLSSYQLLVVFDKFRGSTKQLRWVLMPLAKRNKLVPAKPEYWISFSSLARISWVSSSMFDGDGKVLLPCPSSILRGIGVWFGLVFVLVNAHNLGYLKCAVTAECSL